MCGINGFNWNDAGLIARMNAATKHRGPDGVGAYSHERVSLGHNRLAIIDLSERAAQPMKNHAESVVLTFNGEIYNYQTLKREIGDYSYKSGSDTEVILAAYEKWGIEAFKRFNGIFAFALWDHKTHALHLVRDRAGIKPLYYFWDGKRLIFSSEIKGILEHDVPRVINRDALVHYLRVLYVPAPHTMFRDIQKLEPGHTLTLFEGKVSIQPFADRVPDYGGPVTDGALCSTFDQVIERQLMSDRPIGLYLSGGFDSSILLDCLSRQVDVVNTFSVGFELKANETPDRFNADQMIARKTAAHYGAVHHEIMLSGKEAAVGMERMVWHLDEPIGNPTTIPMMHLAQFTKPLATVVYGGDGGDELFGGYERYRLSLLSSYYQRTPSALRRFVRARSAAVAKLDTAPGVERYAQFLFQKDAPLRRVLAPSVDIDVTRRFFEEKFFNQRGTKDFEELFMDVDRRSWLIDESLMRTDKMSMAAGVEVRVPFLDNDVVAFASRIPRNQKVTLFESKKMLKRAFRGRLPDFLYKEPKRGWFSPGAKWFRNEHFRELASEVLSASYSESTRGLFQWDEIHDMLEAHQAGREYHLTTLWALLVLQMWARQYNVRS